MFLKIQMIEQPTAETKKVFNYFLVGLISNKEAYFHFIVTFIAS